MDEFLTPKAKNRIWEIPVMVILLFIASVGLGVTMEDLAGGEEAVGIGVDFFLLFLLLFPVYRIIRRRLQVREAGKLAKTLRAIAGDRISLAKLGEMSGVRGELGPKIRNLMDKKFLQGLEFRPGEDLVRMTSAERIRRKMEEESLTRVVECRSCGAKKIVKRGERTKCDYCGSPLKTDM